MLRNPSFHHIELPADDLELAERFYGVIFGARVYMRRDKDGRKGVPADGTIADAEASGFAIDATYLRIGESLRIGFLKRSQSHDQTEIDHLAFTIDDEELVSLTRKLTEYKIEVVDQAAERIQIRDPFGLTLELWPRSVLARMGLL
ncbi:MAG TPA: VOC family protein [Blastocatellia bacterium]|nr:VOC family protein [Blastocatellia bacterium]